jgi:hypothetical protein
MKSLSIAAVLFAACGHAAPPATHEVAHKPAPADAQVEAAADVDAGDDTADAGEEAEGDGDDESGQDCNSDTAVTMHLGGKDADAHIETCVDRAGEHHGPDFETHQATTSLVIERGGEDHDVLEIASYEKGGEEGADFGIVGVLSAPKGDDVVLVETSAYGAAEGLHAVNAAVVAYAVKDGAIHDVYTLEANLITVQVSKDHRFATVSTCVPPDKDGDPGTGGGACDEGQHYDGDGKKLQLRWDGHAIKVIAVKH